MLMIRKFALCAMMLGSLSTGITANAVTEDVESNQDAQELIEKAEALSQTSGEDIVIVDGYEVALGEPVSVTMIGETARNAAALHGSVQVSRPLFGGV
jgi:hypothetical protein